VAIAIWNGTLDQSKTGGDARLGREVRLAIDGLPDHAYTLRHRRVDLDHSNIQAVWAADHGGDWPDDAGWARLRAADRLEDFERERRIEVTRGGLDLDFDLPMPAVSLIELVPAG
jgi:xylan 1,4-beta-xylosidase